MADCWILDGIAKHCRISKVHLMFLEVDGGSQYRRLIVTVCLGEYWMQTFSQKEIILCVHTHLKICTVTVRYNMT